MIKFENNIKNWKKSNFRYFFSTSSIFSGMNSMPLQTPVGVTGALFSRLQPIVSGPNLGPGPH